MMTRGGEGGKKCRKFDDVILNQEEVVYYTIILTRV